MLFNLIIKVYSLGLKVKNTFELFRASYIGRYVSLAFMCIQSQLWS